MCEVHLYEVHLYVVVSAQVFVFDDSSAVRVQSKLFVSSTWNGVTLGSKEGEGAPLVQAL